MDAKLQRRIQRYGWDKAVDMYEQHWQQQLAPAQTRLLEMADIRPGDRVLDVACGTGLVTCASTMGKISAHPQRSRRPQTAATARPPGCSTRYISCKALTGCGTYIKPSAHRATSKVPSGSKSSSASMRAQVT